MRLRAPGSGGHLRANWHGHPASRGIFRVGCGGAGGGGPRQGAGRGRERAPPPRARLPPAFTPPRWEPGSARPGGWRRRRAGTAGCGRRRRGRARRAPGAAWAARGPGRCSAWGSCFRQAAPHGASREPSSPGAGKGFHATSVLCQPWDRGSRHPDSRLRASPELGKKLGSLPQWQSGWGQGPGATPLSSRGSRNGGNESLTPCVQSRQTSTASSSSTTYPPEPQWRGAGGN